MRVLVLGGGYAGVTLVRRLERRLPEDAEITLVDESGDHLVQHELHRVVRRPEITDEIVVPLESITDRATIREGTVAGIDPGEREVTLTDGDVLEYDVCAIALGAETADYGLPGVREHGQPLKRVEHARAIRERFLDVLADGDRVVVGGAGLSGIQVAGELAALAESERSAVGEDVEIVVLEQRSSVAPGFDASFQAAIHDALVDRGIEVRTDARVERATETQVELANEAHVELTDEEPLAYDQFVWTGGIAGPAALDGERPRVDARLRLADRTFVLGDAARVVDRDGEAVPASAQAAIRMARTVADNVGRIVEYEREGGVFEPRLDQFDFESPGWVVSVGDGAVATVGGTVVTGTAAVALKTTVGVGYLSSVGAIRDAVDLVNDELGLGVDEDYSSNQRR